MKEKNGYKLRLIRKEEICKDTFGLYFDIKNTGFNYIAGQFTTVTISDLNASDGKGNQRHFSIANAPGADDFIEIIIRKSGSDFSNCILTLAMGTVLLFDEPRGEIQSDKIPNDVIFIAGGTGITPVRSILQDFKNKNVNKKIILFYANRSIEYTAFFDEMKNFEEENASFRFIPILEEESDDVSTETGFFSEKIFNSYVKDIGSYTCYVTGPPMMLSKAIKVLVNCGVPDEKIVIENT